MDTEKYLTLAHEQWGNADTLIGKRNMAFAETYAVIGDLFQTWRLAWHHIHFGDSPFLDLSTRVALPPSCVQALEVWMKALWELDEQINVPMAFPVFNWRTELERLIGDIGALAALNLDIHKALDISDLLSDHEYAVREQKKQESKAAKAEKGREKAEQTRLVREAALLKTDAENALTVLQELLERIVARKQINDEKRQKEALLAEHQRKLELARELSKLNKRTRTSTQISEPIKLPQDNPYFPPRYIKRTCFPTYLPYKEHEREIETKIAWQEDRQWASRMYVGV